MIKRAIVLAHRLVLEGDGSANLALLHRSLGALSSIGVTEVCVVDGEHADEVRSRLSLAELGGMRVYVLPNRSWRREAGAAVLVARDFLTASEEPCLILRGDRPLDPEALAELANVQLLDASAVISVAAPPKSDLGTVVKVRIGAKTAAAAGGLAPSAPEHPGDLVTAIGLDLDRYDAVFTGHLLASPSIVELLERFNNPRLEDALAMWAATGKLRVRAARLSWLWGLPQHPDVGEPINALLSSKGHPGYTLLNPGPVNTTPAVKAALVHPDVSHRDSSFTELMVSLSGKLRRIFRGTPEHSVCCITGSGTAAMESVLASTVPYDRKVLVVDNGAFGERLFEICRLHEMDVVRLRYAWGDVVDPADVERAFAQHPDISAVAMTAHETSVGLLNPVAAIGAICHRHDALLLVDAVSALGAEDIDVVRDHIDVCWSSANKCLHAISGVSFVCVAPRVWPKIATIRPRSFYLDLKRYRRYIEELGQTPFTPAVSAYFALDAACTEFLADGHRKRFAMYRERNRRMRQGLAALGMAPFTRTGQESNTVTTCCVPEDIRFEDLYAGLKKRGYIIYACKDVLADRFCQVANMGDLPIETIDRFLAVTHEVIQELRSGAVVTSSDAGQVRASA